MGIHKRHKKFKLKSGVIKKMDFRRNNMVPARSDGHQYTNKLFALFDWQSDKKKKRLFGNKNMTTLVYDFIVEWYKGYRMIPGLSRRLIRRRPLTATQFYWFMNNY